MKLAEFGELLEGELGVFHDEVHVHFVTEHLQCSRFGCFRAAFFDACFDAFFDASAFDAFAEITHVIDLLFKGRSHGDLKVILQDLFFFGGAAFLQEQAMEREVRSFLLEPVDDVLLADTVAIDVQQGIGGQDELFVVIWDLLQWQEFTVDIFRGQDVADLQI